MYQPRSEIYSCLLLFVFLSFRVLGAPLHHPGSAATAAAVTTSFKVSTPSTFKSELNVVPQKPKGAQPEILQLRIQDEEIEHYPLTEVKTALSEERGKSPSEITRVEDGIGSAEPLSADETVHHPNETISLPSNEIPIDAPALDYETVLDSQTESYLDTEDPSAGYYSLENLAEILSYGEPPTQDPEGLRAPLKLNPVREICSVESPPPENDESYKRQNNLFGNDFKLDISTKVIKPSDAVADQLVESNIEVDGRDSPLEKRESGQGLHEAPSSVKNPGVELLKATADSSSTGTNAALTYNFSTLRSSTTASNTPEISTTEARNSTSTLAIMTGKESSGPAPPTPSALPPTAPINLAVSRNSSAMANTKESGPHGPLSPSVDEAFPVAEAEAKRYIPYRFPNFNGEGPYFTIEIKCMGEHQIKQIIPEIYPNIKKDGYNPAALPRLAQLTKKKCEQHCDCNVDSGRVVAAKYTRTISPRLPPQLRFFERCREPRDLAICEKIECRCKLRVDVGNARSRASASRVFDRLPSWVRRRYPYAFTMHGELGFITATQNYELFGEEPPVHRSVRFGPDEAIPYQLEGPEVPPRYLYELAYDNPEWDGTDESLDAVWALLRMMHSDSPQFPKRDLGDRTIPDKIPMHCPSYDGMKTISKDPKAVAELRGRGKGVPPSHPGTLQKDSLPPVLSPRESGSAFQTRDIAGKPGNSHRDTVTTHDSHIDGRKNGNLIEQVGEMDLVGQAPQTFETGTPQVNGTGNDAISTASQTSAKVGNSSSTRAIPHVNTTSLDILITAIDKAAKPDANKVPPIPRSPNTGLVAKWKIVCDTHIKYKQEYNRGQRMSGWYYDHRAKYVQATAVCYTYPCRCEEQPVTDIAIFTCFTPDGYGKTPRGYTISHIRMTNACQRRSNCRCELEGGYDEPNDETSQPVEDPRKAYIDSMMPDPIKQGLAAGPGFSDPAFWRGGQYNPRSRNAKELDHQAGSQFREHSFGSRYLIPERYPRVSYIPSAGRGFGSTLSKRSVAGTGVTANAAESNDRDVSFEKSKNPNFVVLECRIPHSSLDPSYLRHRVHSIERTCFETCILKLTGSSFLTTCSGRGFIPRRALAYKICQNIECKVLKPAPNTLPRLYFNNRQGNQKENPKRQGNGDTDPEYENSNPPILLSTDKAPPMSESPKKSKPRGKVGDVIWGARPVCTLGWADYANRPGNAKYLRLNPEEEKDQKAIFEATSKGRRTGCRYSFVLPGIPLQIVPHMDCYEDQKKAGLTPVPSTERGQFCPEACRCDINVSNPGFHNLVPYLRRAAGDVAGKQSDHLLNEYIQNIIAEFESYRAPGGRPATQPRQKTCLTVPDSEEEPYSLEGPNEDGDEDEHLRALSSMKGFEAIPPGLDPSNELPARKIPIPAQNEVYGHNINPAGEGSLAKAPIGKRERGSELATSPATHKDIFKRDIGRFRVICRVDPSNWGVKKTNLGIFRKQLEACTDLNRCRCLWSEPDRRMKVLCIDYRGRITPRLRTFCNQMCFCQEEYRFGGNLGTAGSASTGQGNQPGSFKPKEPKLENIINAMDDKPYPFAFRNHNVDKFRQLAPDTAEPYWLEGPNEGEGRESLYPYILDMLGGEDIASGAPLSVSAGGLRRKDLESETTTTALGSESRDQRESSALRNNSPATTKSPSPDHRLEDRARDREGTRRHLAINPKILCARTYYGWIATRPAASNSRLIMEGSFSTARQNCRTCDCIWKKDGSYDINCMVLRKFGSVFRYRPSPGRNAFCPEVCVCTLYLPGDPGVGAAGSASIQPGQGQFPTGQNRAKSIQDLLHQDDSKDYPVRFPKNQNYHHRELAPDTTEPYRLEGPDPVYDDYKSRGYALPSIPEVVSNLAGNAFPTNPSRILRRNADNTYTPVKLPPTSPDTATGNHFKRTVDDDNPTIPSAKFIDDSTYPTGSFSNKSLMDWLSILGGICGPDQGKLKIHPPCRNAIDASGELRRIFDRDGVIAQTEQEEKAQAEPEQATGECLDQCTSPADSAEYSDAVHEQEVERQIQRQQVIEAIEKYEAMVLYEQQAQRQIEKYRKEEVAKKRDALLLYCRQIQKQIERHPRTDTAQKGNVRYPVLSDFAHKMDGQTEASYSQNEKSLNPPITGDSSAEVEMRRPQGQS